MKSISRFIRNEKYMGKVVSGDKIFDDIIPAIVDEKLFRACNLIMDEHKHKQRIIVEDKPYILSGKLYCGDCNAFMTAEAGTGKSGRTYHYYKCFNRKRKKEDCSKKNYAQKKLEDLVFDNTIEYILQPEIIKAIAEIVVNNFNSEISKTGNLMALERELREKDKSINAIMSAIEQGVITKTTQARLMVLEQEKDELEDKILLQKTYQIKPMEVEEVKAFLNYYARKEYTDDTEKKDFFLNFINRVILYDDRMLILYNTTPDSQIEVKISEDRGLISMDDIKNNKKVSRLTRCSNERQMAEDEGFEPPWACAQTVFKN